MPRAGDVADCVVQKWFLKKGFWCCGSSKRTPQGEITFIHGDRSCTPVAADASNALASCLNGAEEKPRWTKEAFGASQELDLNRLKPCF